MPAALLAAWGCAHRAEPLTGRPSRPLILVTYLNVFGDGEHGWSHWRWSGRNPDGSARRFDPRTILGPEPWRRDIGVGVAGDYPLIGPYHCGDRGVVRFQMDCMRRCGVDGVLLYLYDDPAFYSTEAAISMFLDEARRAGLMVGFCDSEGEVAVGERFGGAYSDAFYADALDRAARTLGRYAGHEAYLHIDGRPFWMLGLNMERSPQRVGSFVRRLRKSAGNVYIACVTNAVYYMYEFGVEIVPGWPTTMEETLPTAEWADTGVDCFTCYSPLALARADSSTALCYWQMYAYDSRRWGKGAIAFLMAGYDDSNWRRTVGVIPRVGGEAWRERLRVGMSVDGLDAVVLQCWNEWHEGAVLEPNLGLRDAAGSPDPFLNLRILAEELGVRWRPPEVPPEIVDPLLRRHGQSSLDPFLAGPK